jgi:hypothetical protein
MDGGQITLYRVIIEELPAKELHDFIQPESCAIGPIWSQVNPIHDFISYFS